MPLCSGSCLWYHHHHHHYYYYNRTSMQSTITHHTSTTLPTTVVCYPSFSKFWPFSGAKLSLEPGSLVSPSIGSSSRSRSHRYIEHASMPPCLLLVRTTILALWNMARHSITSRSSLHREPSNPTGRPFARVQDSRSLARTPTFSRLFYFCADQHGAEARPPGNGGIHRKTPSHQSATVSTAVQTLPSWPFCRNTRTRLW